MNNPLKNRDRITRKILVRNYISNKYKQCPVCEARRKQKLKDTMLEIKNEFDKAKIL